MEFDYGFKPVQETGYPLVSIPIVTIELESPIFGSFDYVCFVDSGADFCVFSIDALEGLGLELTNGKHTQLAGIKKGASMAGYLHKIPYKVKGIDRM